MAKDGVMPHDVVEGLEESPQYQKFLQLLPTLGTDQRLPGFPFREPWPRMYMGRFYEIITVTGEKYIARVDDAREYMSEGLEWKKISGGNIGQSCVAAWKRVS